MPLRHREVYRYVLGCGGTAFFVLMAIASYRDALYKYMVMFYTHQLEEFLLGPIIFLILAIICFLVTILYPSKEMTQISGIDKKVHK